MRMIHAVRPISAAGFLVLASALLSAIPTQSALAQGEIHGTTFNDQNGNGVRDPDDAAVSEIPICLDGAELDSGEDQAVTLRGRGGECVQTDEDGFYEFLGVPSGEHTVYEILPLGRTNTTALVVAVSLGDGGVVAVDFGLQAATGPAEDVSIEGDSGYAFNDLPVVNWNNSFRVLKDLSQQHCLTSSPVAAKLVLGPFSDTGNTREVLMTDEGGGIWSADFGPVSPDHGTAAMRFYVDCAPDTVGFPEDTALIAGEDEIQDGGHIYIDPSGRIISACDGSPIEEATVTILRFDDGLGEFQPAAALTPPLIPPVNPLLTDATGAYGWTVIPGTYQVVADKAGWSTAISGELPVPPAQTDVDLALTPDEGCPPPVPQNKEDCKNGGWMTLFRADGSPFKNQGQCIRYVNTGK